MINNVTTHIRRLEKELGVVPVPVLTDEHTGDNQEYYQYLVEMKANKNYNTGQ